MNGSSSVVLNEKCGFCDIECKSNFKILKPNDDFNFIVGCNAEGMSYIDIVCPEDRESVAQRLNEIFEEGEKDQSGQRICACIKHRIILPDASVTMIMLTLRYNADGYLFCAASKIFDMLTGDTIKYKSNNILESVAMSMAVVFITDGGHFIVKYANNDFYEMIGWNRLEFKEVFNECLNDIIYPSDFKVFFDNMCGLADDRSEIVFETRTVTVDGGIKWNEVRAKYLSSENERPVISVIFGDITKRKSLQKELIIKNERFNIIQNSTDQVIFDYDTEADRITFTGNINKISEYIKLYKVDFTHNELVIDDFFNSCCALSFMNADDYRKFCDCFAQAITSGFGDSFDFVMSTIDDSVGLWHRCIFSTVKDEMDDVVRIVGRIKNIDKQKKIEFIIEKRMKCDMLTGLLNKDTAIRCIRDFLDSVDKNCHVGEKFHALMVIDIDNFHIINDTLGHTFGDSVIQEFASDIKSSFRDTDVVGRIGGDEFIILMKNVTVKFAAKKAGKLCRSLVRSYSVHNRNICLSCSIGMAFFGKDANCFDDLYKYADIAMYTAKVNGRCSYALYDDETKEMYRSLSDIHNRTQMDPPSNNTETSELDTNLMDIAFSLISASDDILGALDILLRTTGKKYNLSVISIVIKDYMDNKFNIVSQWCSSRHALRQHEHGLSFGFEKIDSIFNGSNLKCISDVSVCNLPPAMKNKMKNMGVDSCVIGRLEGRSGTHYGYIVFTQFDRKRKWSRKEANTFKYISKIISIALVERYSNHKLFAPNSTESNITNVSVGEDYGESSDN